MTSAIPSPVMAASAEPEASPVSATLPAVTLAQFPGGGVSAPRHHAQLALRPAGAPAAAGQAFEYCLHSGGRVSGRRWPRRFPPGRWG